MEAVNTIKDVKNELLKRRELKILVKNDSNPGFDECKKFLISDFKASDDSIAIKNLKSKFGRDTFLIDAFVYDSADEMQKIEPKPKEKKGATG